MSFTELLPKTKRAHIDCRDASVGMGFKPATARYLAWTTILVRPERINLSWVALAAPVKVQLGDGVDAGKLRISANGPFKFSKGFGRSSGLILHIPGLQTRDGLAQPLRAVSFTIDQQALIIELPGWAMSSTSRPAVASAPGAPFKLGAPSHADVLRGKGVPA